MEKFTRLIRTEGFSEVHEALSDSHISELTVDGNFGRIEEQELLLLLVFISAQSWIEDEEVLQRNMIAMRHPKDGSRLRPLQPRPATRNPQAFAVLVSWNTDYDDR